MAVVFGFMFVGISLWAALQLMGLHSFYGSASQALLVITQNMRCFLIIFVPVILEKFMGLRIDLKVIFSFYIFGILSTFCGEGFMFYYKDPTHTYDKTLHLVAGMMQIYVAFGFGWIMVKDGGGKHKFAFAMLFAFVASMAVAAMWELLEFCSDVFTGSDMQKTVPAPLFNGGDTWAQLNGTDEEIAQFFRNPSGYRYGIMDSMLDMVYCLGGSIFAIIVMAVIKHFKKNAFESCVIYSADYRFKFLQKRQSQSV